MLYKEASEWKHTTTTNSRSHGEPVGIDLFDDEHPNMVSIYQRFGDGTRFPARTVNLDKREEAIAVLGAWMLKGKVNDYRQFGVSEPGQ